MSSTTVGKPTKPAGQHFWQRHPISYWPLTGWQTSLVAVLTIGTTILYCWNLAANGWANSFYSAAAQAGSKSWVAFFYGSLDASNAITVDKTPMSIWFMALSVRLFGLSGVAILLPEVLMGVTSVLLLFSLIRKRFGFWAGMTAGFTLALTPVAALMFCFNNPDALLTLLMILAVGATLRLNDTGNKRWAILIGVFIGFGFLTKMLQAFLILPALAIPYLLFGRPKLGRRILHVVLALAGLLVAAGWWVALVALIPASMRPYIGGSQTNSILELTLGYNGFGRLSGNETGSVVGGGGTGSAGQWGVTGILRMFESDIGGQIAWLIPIALVTFIGGLILLWRTRKQDGSFMAVVVWGLSLLVTGLTFSFMQGIFHQYYTVALAPYIAALTGIFVGLLIRYHTHLLVRMFGAATIFGNGILAYLLLARGSDYGWLKWVVLTLALIGAIGLLVTTGRRRWLVLLTAITTGVALLAGPTYYTLDTVATGHSGSIVSAGPSVSGGQGGPGGGNRGGFGDGRPGGAGVPTGTPQQGPAGGGQNQTGPQAAGGNTMPGRGQGGAGGLLNASTPSSAIKKLLATDAGKYRWVAAAVGSQNAAGYQLATQLPVMALGGFNGTDPYPTLTTFEKLVAAGKIHYYITGGGGMGNRAGNSSKITTWVSSHFKSMTVDGVTLYDLTAVK